MKHMRTPLLNLRTGRFGISGILLDALRPPQRMSYRRSRHPAHYGLPQGQSPEHSNATAMTATSGVQQSGSIQAAGLPPASASWSAGESPGRTAVGAIAGAILGAAIAGPAMRAPG